MSTNLKTSRRRGANRKTNSGLHRAWTSALFLLTAAAAEAQVATPTVSTLETVTIANQTAAVIRAALGTTGNYVGLVARCDGGAARVTIQLGAFPARARFVDESAYLSFVRAVVDQERNTPSAGRLAEERAYLRPLPAVRLPQLCGATP